jgi:hypothetical protein
MTPSQTIHSVLIIFNWSWWQVFLFVLVADWATIRLLRYLEPAAAKRPDWLSGKYGDLFLPFGIASSVVVLQGFHDSGAWFAQPWWNWAVLITGIVVNISLDVVILHRALKKYTLKQELAPSNIWHSLIFIVLFYMVGMTIVPLFSVHSPAWALLLAFFGYGGWGVTLLYDLAHPSGFVRR